MENVLHPVSDFQLRMLSFGYKQKDILPCLLSTTKILCYIVDRKVKTYAPICLPMLPYYGTEENDMTAWELKELMTIYLKALKDCREFGYKPIPPPPTPDSEEQEDYELTETTLAEFRHELFDEAKSLSCVPEIVLTISDKSSDAIVLGLQNGDLVTPYEILDRAITVYVHMLRLCSFIALPWDMLKAAWAGLQLAGLGRLINEQLYKPLAVTTVKSETFYTKGQKRIENTLRMGVFEGYKVQFGASKAEFAITGSLLDPSTNIFINQFIYTDSKKAVTSHAIEMVTSGKYATKEIREKLSIVFASSSHFTATFQYILSQIPFYVYPLDHYLVSQPDTEEATISALHRIFVQRQLVDLNHIGNNNGTKYSIPAPLIEMVELQFSDGDSKDYGMVPSMGINAPQSCIALFYRVDKPNDYSLYFKEFESIREIFAKEIVRMLQGQFIYTATWSCFNQIEFTESGDLSYGVDNPLTTHMAKSLMSKDFQGKPGTKSTVKAQLGGHGSFSYVNACKIALIGLYGNVLCAAARKGLKIAQADFDCEELYANSIDGKQFLSVAEEFLTRVRTNDLFVQSMLKDREKKNEIVSSVDDLIVRPANIRAPMILKKWDSAPAFNARHYDWITPKMLDECNLKPNSYALEILKASTVKREVTDFISSNPRFIYLRPIYMNVFDKEMCQLDLYDNHYRNAPISFNVKLSYFVGQSGDNCKHQFSIHFSTTAHKIPNYVVKVEGLNSLYRTAAFTYAGSQQQTTDTDRLAKFVTLMCARQGCPVPISLINGNRLTKEAYNACLSKLEEAGLEIEYDTAMKYYDEEETVDEESDVASSSTVPAKRALPPKRSLQGNYESKDNKSARYPF